MTTKEYIEKYIAHSSQKEDSGLSVAEIWKMIAQRKNFLEMGFNTEESYTSWIYENPYINIL